MFVIGVDPGLTGAIALLRNGDLAECFDMPTSGRGQGGKQDLNHAELARLFRELPPCTAYVEHVWGYNKNGVAQSSAAGFRLGLCVGAIRQVTASHGFPMELVIPQTWKKSFSLIGTDKDAARTKAIQLFPNDSDRLQRKRDIGRADAILIALYGHRHSKGV